MNVLFLALYPPDPPVDGGRVRAYNTLRQVARRHRVTLVCFADALATEAHIAHLREMCAAVIVLPRPVLPSRALVHKLRDLARREPVGLSQWRSPAMRDVLARLAAHTRFDLVHVDHLALAQYAAAWRGVPWLLTHHNVEALAQRRQSQLPGARTAPTRWTAALERARWTAYEIAASRSAGALVAVSESEAEYFRARAPRTPVFVVPNGVDTQYFQPLSRRDGDALLFTGSMNYAPNVDAVRWFCEVVLPLVRRTHPASRLLIVGRDPVPQVLALARLPAVTVTGRVDDVRPYYAQAAVVVVPLRAGGGTRLKILEAFAMGAAVVATTIGCEGLAAADGVHLLVADAPGAFAAAVVRLLDDAGLRARLGGEGRELVSARYSVSVMDDQLRQAYASITLRENGHP